MYAVLPDVSLEYPPKVTDRIPPDFKNETPAFTKPSISAVAIGPMSVFLFLIADPYTYNTEHNPV